MIRFSLIPLGLVVLVLFVPQAQAEWRVQQRTVTNTSLRAVHALNDQVVWVGGSKGNWMRTLDGGATWQASRFASGDHLDFRGLVGFDSKTAILMSAGEASDGKARIFLTTDGGIEWTQVFHTEQKGVFLDGIAFWDRKNGIVFGDPIDGKWYLLRTTDGGRSWKKLNPRQFPAMLPGEVAFAASNSSMMLQGRASVWIGSGGTDRSRIFRSSDHGQTWKVSDVPIASGESAGVFGLRFWGGGHGIGVGGDHQEIHKRLDNVVVTDDGGRNWRRAAATEPSGLKEAVIRFSDGVLLAVGPSGTSITRDFATTWEKVDGLSFHAASAVGLDCWAVGGNGVVAKWGRR